MKNGKQIKCTLLICDISLSMKLIEYKLRNVYKDHGDGLASLPLHDKRKNTCCCPEVVFEWWTNDRFLSAGMFVVRHYILVCLISLIN